MTESLVLILILLPVPVLVFAGAREIHKRPVKCEGEVVEVRKYVPGSSKASVMRSPEDSAERDYFTTSIEDRDSEWSLYGGLDSLLANILGRLWRRHHSVHLVRFVANGETFYVSEEGGSHQVGDRVTILHDPADPWGAKTRRALYRRVVRLALLYAVWVFFCLGQLLSRESS